LNYGLLEIFLRRDKLITPQPIKGENMERRPVKIHEKELIILLLRWNGFTLRKIAEAMNLSNARIRQIEYKSIVETTKTYSKPL